MCSLKNKRRNKCKNKRTVIITCISTVNFHRGVDISLKICIIQARSNNEEVMNSRANISDYFIEEPKAEHFHITVYPGQNNLLYHVAL